MEFRALGPTTDMMLARFDGEVLERETHAVVRTPTSPRFWWGNFILLPEAPRPGDIEAWIALFAREFEDLPEVRHVCLVWSAAMDALDESAVPGFQLAGLTLESSVYLQATELRPPSRILPELGVRPLSSDGEWKRATEIEHACAPADSGESFLTFQADQMRRYRAMAQAGLGRWFGAFLDGEQVAGMGIFVENGLGRCQAVGTHPSARRRGACSTMVHRACAQAFESLGAERILILSEPGGEAMRLYRRVGFRPVEGVMSLARPGGG